ncbi:hypothetical protein D3C85_1789540 [compost metagenome]
MHVLAKRTFAFQHVQHFAIEVERLDDRPTALPQIIQPIPQRDPTQKFVAITLQRHQL